MQRSFFKIVQKTVSSPTLRFEHLGSGTHKRINACCEKNQQSKGVDLWSLCQIEPFEFPFSFPAEKRPN